MPHLHVYGEGSSAPNNYHKPGHAGRMARKWQAEVRDSAVKAGSEWTGDDLKLALNREIPARDVAKQLGRTLYAVRSVRYKDNKAKRKADES